MIIMEIVIDHIDNFITEILDKFYKKYKGVSMMLTPLLHFYYNYISFMLNMLYKAQILLFLIFFCCKIY